LFRKFLVENSDKSGKPVRSSEPLEDEEIEDFTFYVDLNTVRIYSIPPARFNVIFVSEMSRGHLKSWSKKRITAVHVLRI
jgi:hypothetical protein